MKEIFKITLSLTAVCIGAAVILGAVYTQTEHIRKEQEEKTKRETVEALLGFGPGKQIPSDLHVYSIYRYVLSTSDGTRMLGYVLPIKGEGHVLLEIDLSGQPGRVIPLKAKEAELAERGPRDRLVSDALGKGVQATYAQTLYVADLGDKRLGYVVPSITQGFKTFIKMMVSLDPKFTLYGIAITESEEDPGLGAEIQQPYFKNQFAGKTLDQVKTLQVIKEPMPPEYYTALDPEKAKDAGLTKVQVQEIRNKFHAAEIYALTGATISSRAVLNGVKNGVRKFAYRWEVLKAAITKQNIQTAF